MNNTTQSAFYEYSGLNRARSSDVKLIATEGIIQKIRPNREREGLWREFFALHVWREIFSEYNKRAPGIKLLSPNPDTIDENLKSITMSFLGGNDYQYLYKKYKQGKEFPFFDPVEKARNLGKLLRIKEIEKVKHGDLRLRHLLAGSTNPGATEDYLGLIDVEGFRPSQISDVLFEHAKLITALLETSGNIELQQAVWEGYDSVPLDSKSIIRDVMSDIKTRIGVPKGLNLYK